jgi:hypothetical protein
VQFSGNSGLPKLVWALVLLTGVSVPVHALAVSSTPGIMTDLSGTWQGILSLVIFFVAYALIISEEAIHLRKSKPIMVAAGIIWLLVAIAFIQNGDALGAGVAF